MESVVPVLPRTLWPHIRRGHGGAPEADPPGVRLVREGLGLMWVARMILLLVGPTVT